MTSEQASLFQSIERTKTATDLLVDIIRHTEGRMSKNEITQRWQGHSWSSTTMRQWAIWQWRNAGLTTERPK